MEDVRVRPRMRDVEDLVWLEAHRHPKRVRWWPTFLVDMALGVGLALGLVGIVILFLARFYG